MSSVLEHRPDFSRILPLPAREAGKYTVENAFFHLDAGRGCPPIHLKCEGFNLGGSIKIKAAAAILDDFAERNLLPGPSGPRTIIESSSGNMGIALSIVCRMRGLRFVCVTDPNASPASVRLMKAYGADVVVITDRDQNGGYLHSRIEYIRQRLKHSSDFLWTNQYANPVAMEVHARTTCPAILALCPRVDYLFVGAGTTGTLMGCCAYFRAHSPATQVIGVDTVGSVTFGGPPGKRYIPGLGASRRAELYDPALPHATILVPEAEAITMCRWIQKDFGVLVGGSTGTVLAGIRQLSGRLPSGSNIVAISPDFGDRYVDTIYNDDWVAERFPELALPHTADRMSDILRLA